ncbi:MAG: hypothetical protein GY724_28295 [Actinomycetia bacterium]|nr:hypothetical protein [Actinomycetes bacterium]MCP4221715.1 hypothetical protein [Actinomycetes bacterium]MCP5034166.1 hypothetical protein [Actinomycetes bacterium]
MRALPLILATVALMAAACSTDEASDQGGDSGGEATVIIANTPGTLSTNGPQRVLVALLSQGDNEFLGGEGVAATIEFTAPNGGPTSEVAGQWLSTNAAPLGLYVAPFAFDQTGRWEVTVEINDEGGSRALIDVFDESAVPETGDPAPQSKTPTATGDDDLAAITTDLEPDASLYQLSIDEAVTNGRPTVIVFATPAFCQTALCGPTLEIVKEAAAEREGLDIVHVEPFELELARAGSLVPVDTMAEWQLATEPWVFVVDANGLISASFEGILGVEEINAAIDAL